MTTLILEDAFTAKSDSYGDMRGIRRCFVRPGNVIVNVYFKLEYEKDGLMYYSYSYTVDGVADEAEIKSWLRSLTIRAPWKATGNARAIVL